jgi:hypothetical protein
MGLLCAGAKQASQLRYSVSVRYLLKTAFDWATVAELFGSPLAKPITPLKF